MASIPAGRIGEFFGGVILGNVSEPTVNFAVQGGDWRAKLLIGAGAKSLIDTGFGDTALGPLSATGGIIFPYTPTVFLQHNANYSASQLTHSNYDHPTFDSHNVGTIQVTGQFTANTNAEADYMRAVLHFFRVVTKMFFGQDVDPIAGTPPPICRFSSHGKYVLTNVPVVVESFSMELPNGVDYIRTSDGESMMPSSTIVTANLKPTYTRLSTTNEFGLRKFANGDFLLTRNRGFI